MSKPESPTAQPPFGPWWEAVVGLMATRLECSLDLAALGCGDLEEEYAEGLSPDETADELCHAMRAST